MTATHFGDGNPATPRFQPIVRRSSPQEQVIAWGLVVFGFLGLVIGLAIMRYGLYREVLICAIASTLCFLMGYLTLRPRTVFDRSGIHSRTVLRSYDIAWPDSRSDFVVGRYARSIRRHVNSGDPSVYAKVHSNGDVVELGGMITWAPTEARAHQLMDIELDQIWNWAASWGLVPLEDDEDNGAHGAGSRRISFLRRSTHRSVSLYDADHGNEDKAA